MILTLTYSLSVLVVALILFYLVGRYEKHPENVDHLLIVFIAMCWPLIIAIGPIIWIIVIAVRSVINLGEKHRK